MTNPDPTTDAPLFDAKRTAQTIREFRAHRRSELETARARLAAVEQRDAEFAERAEELHNRVAARKQEAEDYRRAQAERINAMPPAEFAAYVAQRVRRTSGPR